jgi:hypothetical protein
MKIIISELIRKVASAIELDRTPTDKDLEEKKESRMKPTSSKVVKPRSKDDTVEHEVIKPTARPGNKPTRRTPSYKPSDWDSKQHRTDYMQDWRAEGKDVETGNKYIKKNKNK